MGHGPAPARLAGRGARPVLRPRRARTAPGSGPRDFLAAATPGAGKTTFALRLASELLRRRVIDRIVVVAPTEHLKTQWADAAARVSIRLDPAFSNRHFAPARHYHGVAVTYAQVAVKASVHQRLVEDARTLVILDEVHHGGDALSWGDALREAYGRATRRLLLSGTPFRSDTAPIPFVEYHPDEHGIRLSRTDYSYGYRRALEDGVVRPVIFLVYRRRRRRWRCYLLDRGYACCNCYHQSGCSRTRDWSRSYVQSRYSSNSRGSGSKLFRAILSRNQALLPVLPVDIIAGGVDLF